MSVVESGVVTLGGGVGGQRRGGRRVRPMARCSALLVTTTRNDAFTSHPTYCRLQTLRLMPTRALTVPTY